MEQFVEIPDFPGYEVSSYGKVYNSKTGRELARSPNQQGILTVGMMQGDTQKRRSVRKLVARAFVDGESPRDTTPIQLNGNQNDCSATNLVWRPRWFAWEYMHQFTNPPEYAKRGPILDVTHGVEYPTVMHAAKAGGYLVKHLYIATLNEGRVYPTGDEFIFLSLYRELSE